MSVTNTPVVLITGANGYIGSATVLELIKHGYQVKAVVRRASSGEAFTAKYPEQSKSIEWVTVPDITDLTAMTAALANVDYVIHLASPFVYSVKDNEKDLLLPAKENTEVILQAAAAHLRVKHMVLMSSFAAVSSPMKGAWPEHTYTDEDWNPTTWEEATQSLSVVAYTASKAIAEKAAWDFVNAHKGTFTLTTLCPPMVYGPPMQPFNSLDKLKESVAELWQLFSGKVSDIPVVPVFIDVRDLALLSVQALTNTKAKNQRYLAVGGHFNVPQLVEIVNEAFPAEAHRMLPQTVTPPEHFKTDCSKIERDFGTKWTTLEKSVVDTAAALFEAEKKFAH